MRKLKMATVCSGVGAPEVAYHDLFESVWCCEFDKFPSAVLAERFPNLPNLGDMTKLSENPIYLNEEIDLLVGGTPCQGFSVAGARKGLENDDRAKLTLEFVEILRAKQPKWFIWENVPGVFSTGEGEDFKAIIEAFTNVGYGVSWRVLDAQHFGVPQRRRRVFVVGYLGDWRPSFEVLFEPESLQGYFEESGEEGCEDTEQYPGGTPKTVGTLLARGCKGLDSTSVADGKVVLHGSQNPIVSKNTAHCLGRNSGQENVIVSIAENQRSEIRASDTLGTLATGGGKPGQGYECVLDFFARRLTPLEYERAQGFPDNWTRIPWRGKPEKDCPDSHRYKGCGNSMAVPVMRWIGERLLVVDQFLQLQSVKNS